MRANTAEPLSRGMKILSDNMGIVEAEKFIFLVKTEDFDYTTWQADHFENKTKDEMDADMDKFYAEHPYNGEKAKII
jgi:hypothetical protein